MGEQNTWKTEQSEQIAKQLRIFRKF